MGRYWNKMGVMFVWSIERGFLNGMCVNVSLKLVEA